MSKRIRLYACPECAKYGLTQAPRSKVKRYVCKYCKATITDLNLINFDEWEDSAGDVVTSSPIDSVGQDEAILEEVILILQNAESIVACIPSAVRDQYPEDINQAAVKYYMQHKDIIENL